MKRYALIVLAGGLIPVPLLGQTAATPLITHSIDDANRVTFHGNVHPLAQARYDIGVADVAAPARRLVLLLNRPADREAALAQYMQDIHAPGSATYHEWITPEEFGRRFGPADSDIQQVSNWLNQMGFQVAGASKGRTLLEFSGNVGQVNKAFHTQIHQYAVNGQVHYANATDPEIPEGLAGIVRGVSSLNDFHPGTNLRVVGAGHVDPAARRIAPDDNLNSPLGLFHGVGPEDFATQYDLAPLYAAGTNGSGKVIGIINDSNIDVNLANAYRSMFNLPANPAQVVLDGDDPGINGDAEEAYLDVEMAGAVAPGATVNLYIASWDVVANALNDPLILAARRAVEDNQADVLSLSFGECEAGIGLADNQILASLWEQAAAQGQTVFVSSGDAGSADCDNPDTQGLASDGLQVNGFASTPWNVAVGGTDFYYSDYATGGASAGGLWNAANDPNLGSLKAPLPEQVWNDAYGLNIVNPGNTNNYQYNIIAGGGGASSCVNPAASPPGSSLPFVCDPMTVSGTTLYGYAKPSWQSAPGVPVDGVRDLPDVSLFAANGFNLSAYVICANPGDCTRGSNQQTPVTIVGGTSSAAPAMAGIMALIDQKYGRQGQANYTLYPLAQQKASVFHDVTAGGNNVPCEQGTTNCVFATNSYSLDYTLSGYSAKTGYDLASGLGSVDADALVTNWESLSFASTTTALQLSSSSVPHGTPITAAVNVASSSGGATPQGGVSILTNSLLPASQSLDLLTLGSNGSASGSISSLPGGSYQIWANYGGDGLHTASHSSPASISVTPEVSTLNISGWNTGYSSIQNPATACTPVVGAYESPVANGSSTSLGVPLWLTVQPAGVTSGTVAPATGATTFTLDGQPATIALNVSGIATWAAPLLGAGTHTATASYAGDASYGPSTSLPFTYTVTKYQTGLQISPGGVCNATCTLYAGDSLPVEVYLRGQGCFPLTGSVTVTLGAQTQSVTLTPAGYPTGQVLTGLTTFTNLQAGTYPLSTSYSGDINNQAVSFPPEYSVAVTAVSGPRVATTTAVLESASVLAYGNGGVFFTVTVTGGSGSNGPPTGSVVITQNGAELFVSALTPSGPNTATGTAGTTAGLGPGSPLFNFGLNEITAIYSGDSTYQTSVSPAIPLTYVTSAVTPDFTLAPQLNQVTVQPGSSGMVSVNLAPFYGFSGAVALSCTPSSSEIACSVNPGTVTVNGQATAMLTITVAAQAVGIADNRQEPVPWPMTAGMLGLCFFLVGVRTSRKFGRSVLFSLCVVAAISASGCGSRGTTSTTTTPSPVQTTSPTLIPYSVLVTGTSSSIVHTAKINVAVP